jgi:hypothetical protein
MDQKQVSNFDLDYKQLYTAACDNPLFGTWLHNHNLLPDLMEALEKRNLSSIMITYRAMETELRKMHEVRQNYHRKRKAEHASMQRKIPKILETQTVRELKALLEECGVSKAGKKSELVSRLMEFKQTPYI